MKPRNLKIEGLNSFIECQEIDFTKLTERGLFGIFGPTGCGKSTILDAITIAMYGKIARGSTDFINSCCSELKVSYEFEIGPAGERKIYCIDRVMKKDKNDPRKYKTSLARIVDKTDGGEKVTAEKARDVEEKIQEILGLTFDDFTRSVVLPQGKFSEFLKLKPTDRGNMLERIFGLEKYGKDLMKKVKHRAAKIYQQKLVIDTKIGEHGNINDDVYKSKCEDVKRLTEEEKAADKSKKDIDRKYESAKRIWDFQEEMNIYLKRMEDARKDESKIENMRVLSSMAKKSAVVMPVVLKEEQERRNYEMIANRITDISQRLEAMNKNLKSIEDSYEKILERKNIELPELIKRESSLSQAVEIKSDIEKLNAEIDSLQKQYDDDNKALKDAAKVLDSEESEKSGISNELANLESRKEKVEVDADFRNEIITGTGIEKKLSEMQKSLYEINSDIAELDKNIDDKKKEQSDILNNKNAIIKKISDCESSMENLKKHCPGDESTVIALSSELENVKRNYDDYCRAFESCKKLKSEIEKTENDLKKAQGVLASQLTYKESIRSKRECTAREIERAKADNMAYSLYVNLKDGDPCPVCGSIHHELKLKPASCDIEGLNAKAQLLDRKYSDAENEVMKVQSNVSSIEKDLSIKKGQHDEFEKLLSENNIDNLKEIKNEKEYALDRLRKSIEKWKKDVEDLNSSLSESRDELSKCSMIEAKTNESIKNYVERKSALMDKKAHSEKDMADKQSEYDELKKKLNVDNMAFELSEIKKRDVELESLTKKEKLLRKKLDSVQDKLENAKKQVQELNTEISKTEEIKKLKQSQRGAYAEKINKLCGECDPSLEIVSVKNSIEYIQKEEKKLKKDLDIRKQEMDEAEKEKVAFGQDKINSGENLSKLKEELQNKLTEAGIDLSDAEKYSLGDDKIKEMDDEIKSYDDYVKRTQSSIDMVNEKLNGGHIDEDKWKDLCTEKGNAEVLLNSSIRELAASENELKEIKRNLDEVQKLLKDKKVIDHDMNIMYCIERIIKGNKFVEFIGLNRLKYVAKTATEKLKEITRGRYALEVSEDGSFVICDYNNGGIRRTTDTLSGGELFITSLALALALSSQIQLKGKAPLEFFFLDEGFGSLDNDLLDVVMNSLESLHNERLCVGIISHVEELKERVPVRLVLEPSRDGHGTKVLPVEYN